MPVRLEYGTSYDGTAALNNWRECAVEKFPEKGRVKRGDPALLCPARVKITADEKPERYTDGQTGPRTTSPGESILPGNGWRRGRRSAEGERVFYRVPVELKPAAADFRSIVLVNLLAKHIRQTQAAGHPRYTVTEMLPDLDQLWLTDHHGRHYSSELRFVAYDTLTD